MSSDYLWISEWAIRARLPHGGLRPPQLVIGCFKYVVVYSCLQLRLPISVVQLLPNPFIFVDEHLKFVSQGLLLVFQLHYFLV